MYKYLCQVIFCLTLINGCRDNSTEGIKSIGTKEFMELIDTISIEINAELLGKYPHWTISYDNYFVGYNYHLHRIDVFNLDQSSFSHSIQLDKRGPNGISSVGYVIKIGDEYLVEGGLFYYRISIDGSIISKIAFKDFDLSKDGYLFYQKGPGLRNYKDLSLDLENNCIYQPVYKYREDGSIDFSSFFMCSVDYINWTSAIIRVKYPEEFVKSYAENSFLGGGHMLRIDHFLVFNFPGSNEVYEYDTKTFHLRIYDPIILNKSEMIINIGDYGNDSFEANFTGQMFSPRYLAVKYNAKGKNYYRLHKTKAKKDDMSDANYYLIKMNCSFKTVAQYNLGDLFSPIFQIHRGYLYFAPQIVDEDALHTLKLYRIKG